MRDGILAPEATFLDYGCGRGDDVRRLSDQGIDCAAWDPVHLPSGEKRASEVVNLGYVVNVIEDPQERMETLREAWGHATKALVISARLAGEARPDRHGQFSDGVITSRGTFQKFFEQQELREWIDDSIGEKSVAAGPGIFYVFRSRDERESFIASRFRARHAAPRVRKSDQIYEANQEILEPLRQFLSDRGRLPDASELSVVPEIEDKVGSLKRAYGVIERVTGVEDWQKVRQERAQELLIYLALVRFSSRPKASELPLDLRLDVKAFFGSYKAACSKADGLLYSAGNQEIVDKACKNSPVGKCTSPALYVHRSALDRLPSVLRVYEGCARAYIGTVEEANIIKLNRDEPRISYLAYPSFDSDPHPSLSLSLTIHLQTFRMRETDYEKRENPPILHRKEEFVPEDHPGREKFARLTRQEERHGLFEEPRRIGLKSQWEAIVAEKGVRFRGHRLVRTHPPEPAQLGPEGTGLASPK